MQRVNDWLAQAHRDLEHAQLSIDMGHFEWACFAAQQAAEKAAKALHLQLGSVAWGHSVMELLDSLTTEVHIPAHVLEHGAYLDRFYIPPRYADAHPAGPPYRHYTRADAEQALSAAREVVEYCEHQIIQAE